MPVRPAPTSTMTSRSGRSMRPPSADSPLASARALMYEMTCEVTRQISVATSSGVLCSPIHRPPGQAGEDRAVGDAVAGGVEHRPVPGAAAAGAGHRAVEHVEQDEERDDDRAPEQVPDREQRQRGGTRSRRCRRRSRCRGSAPGPACDALADRRRHLRHRRRPRSCSRRRSPASASVHCGGQQRPGLAQQLRHHLGAADDGDEVRVPAPARHDVLVQVLGERPARRPPEIEAHVETVGRETLLMTRIACCVNAISSALSASVRSSSSATRR